MKSAGKARSNGLYRHIRTSKEIIRNLLNDSGKSMVLSLQIQTFPKRHLIYHSILLLLHHDKNSVCHEYEEKNLSIPTKTVKYPMYTAR